MTDHLPPAQPVHPPIDIGLESAPVRVVAPQPSELFKMRAARLEALAVEHPLSDYLSFVARVCRLQDDLASSLAGASLTPVAQAQFVAVTPSEQELDGLAPRAAPPLRAGDFDPLPRLRDLLVAMAAGVTDSDGAWPEPARKAVRDLCALDDTALQAFIEDVLTGDVGAHATSEAVLLAAALQVLYTAAAAGLDPDRLTIFADGACPACGSPPLASAVVDWPRAHKARYCTCSLCATRWNVVRVKCVSCGATGGIRYSMLDGAPATLKAETCDTCRTYVKILYQAEAPELEPLADDIATLGLDIKLAESGYTRASVNPFLLGTGRAAGEEAVAASPATA